MSNPQENELSHPLEQVTGEKDVHPEEEGAQPGTTADAPDDEDDTGDDAGGTSAEEVES
ncbi:hypothetical protein QQY24_29470 [Streptomyces sp. TG1A-8]|uniref:hypothetical protein n=1 Tax=Streptomyces sp. TG1A-8 TaxID=3051385 RepID=UPI00265C6450|nr:hypothetical protein [Streptomyces sp. TG1A-8]MDO0929336.1 hypothetical protein [Streptomyces sp. TG1A-8]